MSMTAQRLRGLLAQAGGTRAPASAPAPFVPSAAYLHASAVLARALRVRVRNGEDPRPADGSATRSKPDSPCSAPPTPRDALAHADELPGIALAPGLRLFEHEVAAALPPSNDLRCHPPSRLNLRFLDTETTGLAGGTGTLAFVVALADWRGERLRVRQLLLTRPAGEAAMLDCFAAWWQPGDELVSYNGRSFDAPLLATRCRLHRRANPLLERVHHDLLHRVRRRYRGRWENCRLITAERELLGVQRIDDLPGSAAPAAWRDWLANGRAGELLRVLDHNRQDLVSLALLAQCVWHDPPPPERA